MGCQDDPAASSAFVRFKQHVDSRVASGFNTLLGMATQHTDKTSTALEASPPSHAMDLEGSDHRSWAWDIPSLLSSASYSPPALRHLPQPVPNDLAPGMDPNVFTFDDAFEDLLAVSQGRPLPNLESRYQQRKLLREMFPVGEPAWFWVRRLESQRLVPTPLSISSRLEQDETRRAMEWSELWRAAVSDHHIEPRDSGLSRQRGKPCDPERVLSEAEGISQPGSEDRQGRRSAPDTFDELFTSLTSAFFESQKSWDTFLNIITSQAGSDEKPHGPDAAGETRQVETRGEHVDRAGYLHSTVTRTILDERGNEIGRETCVTMRPADERGNYSFAGQGASGRKPGWFWT